MFHHNSVSVGSRNPYHLFASLGTRVQTIVRVVAVTRVCVHQPIHFRIESNLHSSERLAGYRQLATL
jgi:hypothetical protein